MGVPAFFKINNENHAAMPQFFINFDFLNSILMQTGTVKFFNELKGYGFITPSDSDKDIFVHVSGLIDEIRENDKVQFEVEQGKKGQNAVNVEVI